MSRHTKEAIMDVAETLFAEKGYEATSLREITAEANVNLAAVNYHFGSKSALLEAVYVRRIAGINEARLRALTDLESRHTHGAIPVDELVEAFVGPAVNSEESKAASGLLGRCYMEPERAIRRKVRDRLRETWGPYLDAFERTADSAVDRTELRNRMSLMSGLLAYCMSDPDCPGGEQSESREVPVISPSLKRTLIEFLSSGMGASRQSAVSAFSESVLGQAG